MGINIDGTAIKEINFVENGVSYPIDKVYCDGQLVFEKDTSVSGAEIKIIGNYQAGGSEEVYSFILGELSNRTFTGNETLDRSDFPGDSSLVSDLSTDAVSMVGYSITVNKPLADWLFNRNLRIDGIVSVMDLDTGQIEEAHITVAPNSLTATSEYTSSIGIPVDNLFFGMYNGEFALHTVSLSISERDTANPPATPPVTETVVTLDPSEYELNAQNNLDTQQYIYLHNGISTNGKEWEISFQVFEEGGVPPWTEIWHLYPDGTSENTFWGGSEAGTNTMVIFSVFGDDSAQFTVEQYEGYPSYKISQVNYIKRIG